MIHTDKRIHINNLKQSRLHLCLFGICRSSGHVSQSSWDVMTRHASKSGMVVVIIVHTMTIVVIIVDNIAHMVVVLIHDFFLDGRYLRS